MKRLYKITPLLIIALTAVSCKSSNKDNISSSINDESKFEIQEFYDVLSSLNFKADDGEIAQSFYGPDAMTFDIEDQIETGIIRNEQGIFQVYKTNSGYKSQGMLSPNNSLKITGFINSIFDITYIDIDDWEYSSQDNCYSLFPSQGDIDNYEILVGTGYFYSRDEEDVDAVNIKKNSESTYVIEVIYSEDTLTGHESFNVDITDIGSSNNAVLEAFRQTRIEPHTSWDEYQISALEYYGFEEAPFLSSYTLGLMITFQRVDGYVVGGSVLIAYDCMSSYEKETTIIDELVELGYHDETIEGSLEHYYTKEKEPGINSTIEFRFVSVEEIDAYNRVAYPNGYMQVVYGHALKSEETDNADLNDKLTSMGLPSFNGGTTVTKFETIDYTSRINEEISTSEEGLEIFDALSLEPGPISALSVEIFLYIEDRDDAVELLDSYRESIQEADYFQSEYVLNPTGSINDIKYDTYFSEVEEGFGLSRNEIDLYLTNTNTGEYDGRVTIVLNSYTDLGILFYSYVLEG